MKEATRENQKEIGKLCLFALKSRAWDLHRKTPISNDFDSRIENLVQDFININIDKDEDFSETNKVFTKFNLLISLTLYEDPERLYRQFESSRQRDSLLDLHCKCFWVISRTFIQLLKLLPQTKDDLNNSLRDFSPVIVTAIMGLIGPISFSTKEIQKALLVYNKSFDEIERRGLKYNDPFINSLIQAIKNNVN